MAQAHIAHTWVRQMESGVMDTPIVCGNCKQETTRSHSKSEPAQYIAGRIFTNYYCADCGTFLRCDSTPVPLMKDDNDETGDSSDE